MNKAAKLSKAQQKVVDKMKEGWALFVSYGRDTSAFLGNLDGPGMKTISISTAGALIKGGLLSKMESKSSWHTTVYTLNEEAL